MWTELAARHPFELMILNAIINGLPIYLAFSIAARMHSRRRRGRAGGPEIALSALAVGVLWGGTTILDRVFGLAVLRDPTPVLDLVASEPFMASVPVIGTMIVAAIANGWARTGMTLALCAFYALAVETPLGSPAFAALGAGERAAHWALIALGSCVAAAGAGMLATRSHSSRISAVLAAAWGLKLVGISLLSAKWPGVDILAPSPGIVTPELLWAVTVVVAGAAVVAVAEARRLRSSEYRRAVLRDSERRMRMLADATQEGLLIHKGGVILDVNDRLCRLVGAEGRDCKHKAVGMPLVAVLPEAGDWDAAARFAAGPAETRLARRDGGTLTVEAMCRPLDDGRIVTALRDVSERDQARALAAAERKRLGLALDAADEGFVIYDRDERLVLANKAYLAIQPSLRDKIVPGMTHEDVIRLFIESDLWPADLDRDAYLAERMALFRGGTQDHVSKLADGRWLLARDRKLPTGETVSMRIDVTRVKERERELEESEARVRFLARNDALTGIANRRTFDADLAGRMAELAANGMADGTANGATAGGPARQLALLMIDLDRFKPVNDTHGHAAGDELLRVLAKRFEGELRGRPRRVACGPDRPADIVARIGGDEFAALACVVDEADAMALANRLRAAAEAPVTLDAAGLSGRVSVGACVGVAMAPRDATGGEALLHAADLALYAAKAAGRGRAVAFEPAMAEAAETRRRLERDLRHALERDQIELHYQVQHCVRSCRPVGYEALMRWRHPERGLVPPAEFIPLAEETGLVVPLGRWALERAARDFARLPGALRVAVNVSPVQFGTGDLAADVAHALEVSGLDPARLEVEITEEVLIDDTEATLGILEAVRALGVGLSLDDFGSGYSSLGYLTRFPFTKIKIDRMFIAAMATDERARALVRSILALAASLGLKVTAEGVETQGQLLTLAADGCDEAQGYLLGRPVPLGEIARATVAA